MLSSSPVVVAATEPIEALVSSTVPTEFDDVGVAAPADFVAVALPTDFVTVVLEPVAPAAVAGPPGCAEQLKIGRISMETLRHAPWDTHLEPVHEAEEEDSSFVVFLDPSTPPMAPATAPTMIKAAIIITMRKVFLDMPQYLRARS